MPRLPCRRPPASAGRRRALALCLAASGGAPPLVVAARACPPGPPSRSVPPSRLSSRHRVRQAGQPGQRRGVQEADRLVPRRGRVPAVHGRQRPHREPGELLRPGPQLPPVPRPEDEQVRLHPRRPGVLARQLPADGLGRPADGPEPDEAVPGREQAARPAAGDQGGEREVPEAAQGADRRPRSRRSNCSRTPRRSTRRRRTIREKEAKAVAARREPPPGFGGPGGLGPQPPDLKTFAEKRTASVAAQLAGKSKGYVPQPFGFGPPPGGGGPAAAATRSRSTRRRSATSVKAPPEFEATLFAAPPKVNYPVAIACEPTGAVYVAVDEQGSLGRTPGGGKILRCVDKDGDGKVDDVTVFAKVEHPRGVVYRDGTVWVMHPPTLTRLPRRQRRRRRRPAGSARHRPDDRPDRPSAAATTRPTASAWASTAGSTSASATTASSEAKGKDGSDDRRCAAAASSACGPTAPSWKSTAPACATRSTSPSTRS